MLKTLKWVYDLGVKQERTRIARELENAMTQHQGVREISYDILGDPKSKLTSRRKQRLEFRQAVHSEIIDIVEAIMRPEDFERNPTSIMFPEGKKQCKAYFHS